MLEEIMSNHNTTVLKWGDKLIKLSLGDIEEEINVDKVTKIDINNLVGEILTTPVIVNRWGNILAEVKKQYEIHKMNFDTFCATEKGKIRAKFVEDGKKATIAEVDDALTTSPAYKKEKLALIDSEKAVEVVNNLFWSLKDKSEKLNKLSLTIVREDIQSMKTMVCNGIAIVVKKPRIQEEE